MFTFKEHSDEELLELLKADKFDEFAEELSKSYVNQKLQEPTSQEQQNDDYENAVLMEVDNMGQLLYEESETDNSEKSTEKKTDNRTTTIAFRVSDDELKKIEKRFQQSGFSSKGDFYRFCIMNAFVFNGSRPQHHGDGYKEWFVLAGISYYSNFIYLLCEFAKNQKRINNKPETTDNPKYTMRCYLLRLGMIGAEYKNARIQNTFPI